MEKKILTVFTGICFVISALCVAIKTKDTSKPQIILIGEKSLIWAINHKFIDPGAKAFDKEDGDISCRVKAIGNIEVAKAGKYLICYEVADRAGNKSKIFRTVVVAHEFANLKK
jgi:hypothetical protein